MLFEGGGETGTSSIATPPSAPNTASEWEAAGAMRGHVVAIERQLRDHQKAVLVEYKPST
jgi:hypothetical protein